MYLKEKKKYKCYFCNVEMEKPYIRLVVQKYGIQAFLSWYLSNDGYYGAYEKFLNELKELDAMKYETTKETGVNTNTNKAIFQLIEIIITSVITIAIIPEKN